jgi:hypothetical protein
MSSLARVPGELAAPAYGPAAHVTRSLSGNGVLAGPVYDVVVSAQLHRDVSAASDLVR